MAAMLTLLRLFIGLIIIITDGIEDSTMSDDDTAQINTAPETQPRQRRRRNITEMSNYQEDAPGQKKKKYDEDRQWLVDNGCLKEQIKQRRAKQMPKKRKRKNLTWEQRYQIVINRYGKLGKYKFTGLERRKPMTGSDIAELLGINLKTV